MRKSIDEQVAIIRNVMSKTQTERYCQTDRLQACLNFYEKTGRGSREIESCGEYYDERGQLRASHMIIIREFIGQNQVDISGWL